jgi:hypothetical protein
MKLTTTDRIDKTQRPRRKASRKGSLFSSLLRKLDNVVEVFERAAPELFFKGMVRRLVQRPGDYEPGAAHSTGEELLDVKFVPQEQVGAIPALHARWQETGQITDLSEAEIEALQRAGFRIIIDDLGPYCFWRERQIRHAWVCLNQIGWRMSRARSVKAVTDWQTISRLDRPRAPSLEGCPHTHRTALRDSMIEAITALESELPDKITSHSNFLPTMVMLWEDAVKHLECGQQMDPQFNIANAAN